MNVRRAILFALFVFLFGCASTDRKSSLRSHPELGSWETEAPVEKESVILIPQWHLSPQTGTRNSQTEVPQAKNQTAIFKALTAWITAREIQSVVIEGCEGDLNQSPDVLRNGWSLNDLRKHRQDEKFEEIQTHVGIKLAAKYEKQIAVECGDSLNLIKENQLALSDVRGLAGFKIRIEQGGLSAADRERYVEGLKSVLKLPSNTKKEIALLTLNDELKKSLEKFEEKIHERNDTFLAKIKTLKGRKVIVIGSLHIPDLKAKLLAQKIPVGVWRPIGLHDTDVNLIEQLKRTWFL